MITPSAPPSGTSTSAVIENDLFLFVDHGVLRQPPHAAEEQLRRASHQLRPTGEVGVEPLDAAIVERKHVVLAGLDQEEALELARASRAAPLPGRAPVSSRRGRRAPRRRRRTPASPCHHPRRAVACDRGPAVVVDAAVAEHLEVLGRVTVVGLRRRRTSRPCETPSSGCCWTPLTLDGAGRPAASSRVGATSITWWKCGRISPRALMPAGQWTMVPFRVPPQCDATCFVHWYGSVHRVRPADREVVVGSGCAEVVDARDHELGGLELRPRH